MKTTGIIGKTTLNNREKAQLRYIGRCLARLGHAIVFVPAKGTVSAVREGVEAENGVTIEVDTGVIDKADHTWIVPNRRLLNRLLTAYPNLRDKDNVAILDMDLNEIIAIANEALAEKGISAPS